MSSVTTTDIIAGLRSIGLHAGSRIIAHTSLSAFGYVEGGAHAVCTALIESCETLLLPASSWDLTGVPAPPGLERPNNAPPKAASWAEFDAALADARAFNHALPIDRELGIVPETIRLSHPHLRSDHPLFSYMAVGSQAEPLIAGQMSDNPLGPLDVMEQLDGTVLLLGVDHRVNTCIHLAEQRLGRSRFWRYAKIGEGAWGEFPNIPGESDAFDDIEPHLTPVTREVWIGACRVRAVVVADVLAIATRLIEANPRALLVNDPAPDSRSAAALAQRLAAINGANGGSRLP